MFLQALVFALIGTSAVASRDAAKFTKVKEALSSVDLFHASYAETAGDSFVPLRAISEVEAEEDVLTASKKNKHIRTAAGKRGQDHYLALNMYSDSSCTTPYFSSVTVQDRCLAAVDKDGNTGYSILVIASRTKGDFFAKELHFDNSACSGDPIATIDFGEMLGAGRYNECHPIKGMYGKILRWKKGAQVDTHSGWLYSGYSNGRGCRADTPIVQEYLYNGVCYDLGEKAYVFDTSGCSASGGTASLEVYDTCGGTLQNTWSYGSYTCSDADDDDFYNDYYNDYYADYYGWEIVTMKWSATCRNID